MEIGLHGEAGVAGLALDGSKNVERRVGVRGAFHGHLDRAAKIASAAGDGAGERSTQILAEIETELGELDGDVAGEILGVHLFDHFDVAGADFAGGGFGGDVFAEMIEADVAALLAQFAAGGEGFRESFPGDEASREAELHAAARNGIGDAALGGKPKDKVADEHEYSWETTTEHKVARGGRQMGGEGGESGGARGVPRGKGVGGGGRGG